eukprot:2402040-Amphidinium_carterae.2
MVAPLNDRSLCVWPVGWHCGASVIVAGGSALCAIWLPATRVGIGTAPGAGCFGDDWRGAAMIQIVHAKMLLAM